MYLYVRAAVNVSACTVTYAAQPCSAIADNPPVHVGYLPWDLAMHKKPAVGWFAGISAPARTKPDDAHSFGRTRPLRCLLKQQLSNKGDSQVPR